MNIYYVSWSAGCSSNLASICWQKTVSNWNYLKLVICLVTQRLCTTQPGAWRLNKNTWKSTWSLLYQLAWLCPRSYSERSSYWWTLQMICDLRLWHLKLDALLKCEDFNTKDSEWKMFPIIIIFRIQFFLNLKEDSVGLLIMSFWVGINSSHLN